MRTQKLVFLLAALVSTFSLVTGVPSAAHAASTGPVVPGDGGTAQAGKVAAASARLAAAAPAGYSVLGMDVASYQGNIDWNQQAANGAKFAYAKATEGTSYVNPYFNSQYNGAKAAGLYAGAYVFARPDSPNPVGQADYFIDHAQFSNDAKTLPVMLDLEWPYRSSGNYVAPYPCYGISTSAMVSWIRSFVDQVKARTGRQTLIYTNVNWWNPCTGNSAAFGDQLLDIAHYSTSSAGTLPPGWSNWTVWQYADAGTFPGDQDVFNGSLDDLARLAGGGYAGPPSAVYNPANQALEVYFNSGGSLKEKYWTAADGWSNPVTLAGGITGSPSAVYNPANKALEVYFNSGGSLTETYWTTAGGWSNTVTLAGTMTGTPAAVYNEANGAMEVYFNSGGSLTESYWNATGWHGPVGLGVAISGGPTAVSNPTNKALEVYFNSGGSLTEKYWTTTGGWSNTVTLAGPTSGGPAAVYNPAAGAMEVYFNSGGTLTESYWNATGWHGPVGLGTPIS
jgi:GH25 family lysozyme M1 (1,4-beta-N-acetylmuramidase)/outer membrane protein assembly factor BamE (lipoprotein component of BamABCDE complex)